MKEGHYELKHKRHRILSWTHGSRLSRAVSLAKRLPGRRLLDYGSGDGVFERALSRDSGWRGSIVAADLDSYQIKDCRQRLSDLPGTSFVTMSELSNEAPFETVVCLEVLEHVVETEAVLDHMRQLLVPGGHLVISVPVETGFVLLAKQLMRARFGGDYRYTERYSMVELWTAILPTKTKQKRPIYETKPGMKHHGHKLFNWRWLRTVLQREFTIENEMATPFPVVASQRWFVCRKDR